jgi:proteasome lid subunit RPN8/RPN11
VALPAEDPLRSVAARLVALAEAQPGQEVCGLVVSSGEGRPDVWPLPNRAERPARSYEIAPRDLLQALRRLDSEERVLLAVFHSHLAGGPGLSISDIEGAVVGGEPLLPGVAHVVIELAGGRAMRVRAHRLDRRSPDAVDLWPETV